MPVMTTAKMQQIEQTLNRYGVTDYTIRPDGTVDVDGSVFFVREYFTCLPVKFGIVTGSFDLHMCKNLDTFEGMPSTIGGYFDCRGCPLITSLAGFSTKLESWAIFGYKHINSGGISLILTGVLDLCLSSSMVSAFAQISDGPFKIIEKYLGRPEDIFECQAELIEAGYERYARL